MYRSTLQGLIDRLRISVFSSYLIVKSAAILLRSTVNILSFQIEEFKLKKKKHLTISIFNIEVDFK